MGMDLKALLNKKHARKKKGGGDRSATYTQRYKVLTAFLFYSLFNQVTGFGYRLPVKNLEAEADWNQYRCNQSESGTL